jgi:hypothetical protein
MTVAWTKDAVGHATSDVIVRDPIVVTATRRASDARRQGELASTSPIPTPRMANTRFPSTRTADARHLPEKLQLVRQAPDGDVPISAAETGDAGLTIRTLRPTDCVEQRAGSRCVQPSCRSPRASWSTSPVMAAA